MNSMSRPRYTNTDDDPVSGAAGEPAVDPLAESILYVCALIADRPRAIDRYIDYFGERRPVTRVAACSQPSSPAAWGALWVTIRPKPTSERHGRHERLGRGQHVASAVGSSGSVPRLRDVLRGRHRYGGSRSWASVARFLDRRHDS